jgi:pimeloyl-ACP methyl ester carboxylesterase
MGLVQSLMFPGTPVVKSKESSSSSSSFSSPSSSSSSSSSPLSTTHVHHLYTNSEYAFLMHASPVTKYTVLYFHGNGEDLISVEPLAARICAKYPVRFICPEYAGYSVRHHHGHGSITDCQKVAEAMMNYIFQTYPNEPIIVIGYSIGTGAATWIARHFGDLIYGVVLIAPFASIWTLVFDFFYDMFSSVLPPSIASAHGITSMLVSQDDFSSLNNLSNYHGKLYLFHGEHDTIIPPEHSKKLFDACPSLHKHLMIVPNQNHFLRRIDHDISQQLINTWKLQSVAPYVPQA